jgi:hypothetical protein
MLTVLEWLAFGLGAATVYCYGHSKMRGAGRRDGGTKVGEISQLGTIVPWCSVKAPPVAG